MRVSRTTQPATPSPLPEYWDGEITPDIQQRLREARMRLGLPYKSVGAVLGVDWSTVRKWEKGMSRHCSLTIRPRLERFLAGGYDDVFDHAAPVKDVRDNADADEGTRMPVPEFTPCLKRPQAVHELTGNNPALRKELMREVEALTDAMLAKLVPGGGKSG